MMNCNNPFIIVNIDDNDMNLLLIETYLQEIDATFVNFTDPLAAVEYMQKNPFDMLLVDYEMPQMNGIEVTTAAKRIDSDAPIIMLTASEAEDSIQIQALMAGVNDFIKKPINKAILLNRVRNFIKLRRAIVRLNDQEKYLKVQVDKATANLHKTINELKDSYVTLEHKEHETLRVLSRTAEYKDEETSNHVKRVSGYAVLMAKRLNLDEAQQNILKFAAPLHDLGKVGTPDHILLKPGKLNDDEMKIMRQHAAIGADILQNSTSPYLQAGHIIAASHHEKYDGSGYPQGLAGEAIPLYGRIVAIADVFDALTSMRPYKKAWSFDEAIAFLKQNAGIHFDPILIDLFTADLHEIHAIHNQYQD
ncbi:MAG: response regulator [Sulfuricurvum sp.]|nr:response regulator [Sulfuricurvum sp.]